MSRLIDADALLLALDKRKTYELADGRNRAYGKGVRDAMKDVDKQPTVDAVPVVHGHWIDMGDFEQCSECKGTRLKEFNSFYGKVTWIRTAYCSHCGARMDEVMES